MPNDYYVISVRERRPNLCDQIVANFLNASKMDSVKESDWDFWKQNDTLNQRNFLKWIIHHHHHYYHVVPLARISLTFSRHFSLPFIASGRSSGLHPLSSHSCCMYILAGHPAFTRPYAGVHCSTSLMSSSLLLQQCPACLVCLTWIVFVMGGRWPYSWCFVRCCR